MKKEVPDLVAQLKSLTPGSLGLAQSEIDEMIALLERQKILAKRLASLLARLQSQIDATKSILQGIKTRK